MGYVVVIPHLTFHEVRTPLLRTIPKDEIDDIVVVYEKAILDGEDYKHLRRVAVEKLSKHANSKFALVLTGSYAACVIIYDVLRQLGDVVLLQYDPNKRRYEVIR